MAAHLPGMCAAIFPMPVIGIPMHTTSLGGRDSLYSIVQMPSGIPVATVAINGGANAGLLAAKILATSDEALLTKLKEYSRNLINRGREVKVLSPGDTYTGICRGINERGELLVETEDGVRTVMSGEVSVRGIYSYV